MPSKNIVFLHGFLGSSSDWKPICDCLSDDTLCIDLPGHGQSTHLAEETYSFEGAANFVLDKIKNHCKNPITLVGYSMGGRIALHLAVNHPELISHLILESAHPGLNTEEEKTERNRSDEVLAKKLETVPYPEFLDQWMKAPMFLPLKKLNCFETFIEQRLKNGNPAELAKSLRGMGTGCMPYCLPLIYHTPFPITYITGEKDLKYSRIANSFSKNGKSSVIIENEGHNIHLPKPNTIVFHIKKFQRAAIITGSK